MESLIPLKVVFLNNFFTSCVYFGGNTALMERAATSHCQEQKIQYNPRIGGLMQPNERIQSTYYAGRIESVVGLVLNVSGLGEIAAVGSRILLENEHDELTEAEIIGITQNTIRAMPFQPISGLGGNCRVRLAFTQPIGESKSSTHLASLHVHNSWIGRVIDPLARPIDGGPALQRGTTATPLRAAPPNATRRARLGQRLDLGVRALNLFATCRQGQRLGLFAGSGVGKSTLMSMLARQARCDVAVIALIGERGREVREFIEDDLGEAGLARAVLVIATSDQTPMMRREAAYTAMTIAEHFRDQGANVLLMMDSITRFCLALREIGLSLGEPPATRGYPPSVFAELPRLLERAGPGPVINGHAGQITGLFTVLVEGDDHNEPVADAVRGILDGHVVLDRKIGEAGRYPAIDVLRSLSRTVPGCLAGDEPALVQRARAVLSTQAEMADLVRLGAYRPGTDPAVDTALNLAPQIDALLRQGKAENSTLAEDFQRLRAVLTREAHHGT